MIDAIIDMMVHMQSLLTARWPLALQPNTKNATSDTMAVFAVSLDSQVASNAAAEQALLHPAAARCVPVCHQLWGCGWGASRRCKRKF